MLSQGPSGRVRQSGQRSFAPGLDAQVLCETNAGLNERSALKNAGRCPWGSREDFFFRLTDFDFFFRLTDFCIAAKNQLDQKEDVAPAIREEVSACLVQWQASLRQDLLTRWSEADVEEWTTHVFMKNDGFAAFLGLDERGTSSDEGSDYDTILL